jgi:AcrR family transcriptional regulator
MPKRGSPERIEPRKTPQQDRSIQRVKIILDTASRLIGENGVSAFTMTSLAREAGVPIGSIYQYFPERAAIIRALFDRFACNVQEKTNLAFEGVDTVELAKLKINGMIDWYYYQYRNDPIYLSVWFGTETDHELLRLNIEHSRKVAEIFLDWARSFLPESITDDYEVRCFLVSHLIGSTIRFAVMSDDELAPKILRECKLIMCRSLFEPVGH